jgi:hypothetical protein
LAHLIDEIQRGGSEAKLYAGLLARTLLVNDPVLMDKFGKQVAVTGGTRAAAMLRLAGSANPC